MRAVILAAGVGSRLRPLTDTMPKCLTMVGGRTILANALDHLEAAGVTETALVVGHLQEEIARSLRAGGRPRAMRVALVANPDYLSTGTARSLRVGLGSLPVRGPDVLVVEGDVFFERRLLTALLAAGPGEAMAVEAYRPPLDGSFAVVDGAGWVVDCVHERARPAGFTIEDKHKTVNVSRLSSAFVAGVLVPALDRCLARRPDSSIEEVLHELLPSLRGVVRAVPAAGIRWCEIDDLDDLRQAEDLFRSPQEPASCAG
jgi:choline kinase